jgi:hypothetical protein
MRIVRGYMETAFETGLLAERKKGQLLLSAEPRYLSVNREDLPAAQSNPYNNINLRDIGAEFIQSVEYADAFTFYIRERGGRIFAGGAGRITSVPTDSSLYLQIRPGIIYRPPRKGVAELSYTFSYVPWTGELDYRMAGGQSRGTSHVITFLSDIDAGKHFNLSSMYRGELTRRPEDKSFAPMLHVFSLQVKAFL